MEGQNDMLTSRLWVNSVPGPQPVHTISDSNPFHSASGTEVFFSTLLSH